MFRAAVVGQQKVVTANRLLDGLVIFLGTGKTWVTDILEAETFGDGAPIEAALAIGQEGVIGRFLIDPYAVDVTLDGDRPVPMRLRERIRAEGPTVVYGDEERKKLGGGIAA